MNILNTILQKTNNNLYQSRPQQKQEAKQTIFAPIATTSLIKPDRPQKSYIVDDPFYLAPVNFVNDIKENLVNIAKATTGKSNDHDLGRINDFSMKAGALALAGYLFTHGKTSLSKSMEFVGFGTFFASMALWPKLFIQAPLKAMYGIDIHQKYVDNEGRKKMFFQDPQYIPWDLYNDKQLAELGDKLGVPRDIHNRNEVIKKKAHKIALQGNTLWMLTAGFATPLMSAMLCNGIEKVVTPRSERASFPNNIFGAFASSIEKMRIDRAEKVLKNIDGTVARKLAEMDASELAAYMERLEDKKLTTKTIIKIMRKMSRSVDREEKKALYKQIMDIVPVVRVVPKADAEYIETFWKNYKNHKLSNDDLQSVWAKLLTKEKLAQLSVENGEPVSARRFVNKVTEYIHSLPIGRKGYNHCRAALEEIIGKVEAFDTQIITRESIQKILRLDRKLYEHSLRYDALDKYIQLYMGEVGDSIATNRWINVQKAFFKALDYSKEEIKIAKENGPKALKLLQTKLESLVSDEEKYETAVRKIQRAILDYDSLFMPDAEDGTAQGVKKSCYELIDKFSSREAKMFEDAGFHKMKERVIGSKITDRGSLRANLRDSAHRRVEELRNGMYKLLCTLDFFKRTANISKGSIPNSKFVELYKNFNFSKYNAVPHIYSDSDLLEEIQNFKRILLDATIADHTTKLEFKDRGLYVRAMSLMFSTDFDPATIKALGFDSDSVHHLGKTTFAKSLKKQINDVLYNLGNFVYPHKTKLVLMTSDEAKNEKIIIDSVKDALTRDSLLGKRVSNAVREYASETYNSSTWFRKFGGMSLALVGVTLLSQVFFGRINNQDLQYVRKVDN